MTLDSQGRLVLRESGKIVLPYEHFANAVMLKHMTGPHGLHLSVEATVRAVIDSYTIGRENFGMEKEFIIDVVQSCPNPACRYYKNHIGVAPTSFMDPATFQAAAVAQMSNEFMQQHLPSQISATPIPKNSSNSNSNSGSSTPLSLVTNDSSSSIDKAAPVQLDLTINKSRSTSDRHSSADRHSDKHSKAVLASQQQQQQLAAALIQQQNRAMAQQSLEKFGNLTAIEKQRVLQQLDKKHYEAVAAAAAGSNLTASQMQAIHDRNTNMVSPSMSSPHALHIPSTAQPQSMGIHASNTTAIQGQSPNSSSSSDVQQSFYRSSPVSQTGSHHTIESLSSGTAASGVLDSNSSTNKDLLALHNGAWAQQSSIGGAGHHSQQQHAPSGHLHSPVTASAPIITMPSDSPHNQQLAAAGQEKIIRAFGELMRNMARMKTYIRPSMCKPYGKQSEGLQKSMTFDRFFFCSCISDFNCCLVFSTGRYHSVGAIFAQLSSGSAHSGQLVEDRRSTRRILKSKL